MFVVSLFGLVFVVVVAGVVAKVVGYLFVCARVVRIVSFVFVAFATVETTVVGVVVVG